MQLVLTVQLFSLFGSSKPSIGTSSPSSTLAVAETSGTVAVGVGISHTGVSGSAGAGLSITDNTVGSAANGLYSEKTTAGGSGVYGYSSAQGGSSGVGVTGISSGTSAGVGVYASANGVGNVGYALQAVNNSATGWSVYAMSASEPQRRQSRLI